MSNFISKWNAVRKTYKGIINTHIGIENHPKKEQKEEKGREET